MFNPKVILATVLTCALMLMAFVVWRDYTHPQSGSVNQKNIEYGEGWFMFHIQHSLLSGRH